VIVGGFEKAVEDFMRCLTLVVGCALAFASMNGAAMAWTRAGHMVTAAIAYDDLAAHDSAVIDRIAALMQSHPDRGAFEVAVARATGDARTRRIFLEMARWPDDIRGGMYDHPTWHYALRPFVDPNHAPPAAPPDAVDGEAVEAFSLNLAEARDALAPPSDRAVALCWIFHLVGDIHQPLHNAQLFSARFPDGDRGGGRQYVKDPVTAEPISLHWFWDDSVSRTDDPDAALTRAGELEAQLPRVSLALGAPTEGWPAAFRSWGSDESYPLARSLAYRPGLATGTDAASAVALPADYVREARKVAERRVAMAGYRLADILRTIFPDR
jgi:hypothetical protein